MPQGLIQLNVSRPGVFHLISPCPLLAALAFELARARKPKACAHAGVRCPAGGASSHLSYSTRPRNG